MKRIISSLAVFTLIVTLGACSGDNTATSSDGINVIAREQGSGTKDTFNDWFTNQDDDLETVDWTVSTATIVNSTAEVIEKVSSDKNAIGYISLGSLDSSVKAVAIDGEDPSTEALEEDDEDSYPYSISLNLVTKNQGIPDTVNDFLNYVSSVDGQKIAIDNGYVSNGIGEKFDGGKVSGKITITGSSAFTPLMKQLITAYNSINKNLEITLTTSDSDAGIKSVKAGEADISMISQDIDEDMESEEFSYFPIALDALAIIVNPNSPISNLSFEQVNAIFSGTITSWNDEALTDTVADTQTAEGEATA
jgi:phosphate transport system substrate-binding protein